MKFTMGRYVPTRFYFPGALSRS
ncbi:hypothetical protein PUN28_011977 [Cardiocondyla obscurior]|uniref:Uncharacterized protein n=1 Tax=Cardiocondyla obscurior TaxID=286306 RepID=A0AAW2F8J5_9HYME